MRDGGDGFRDDDDFDCHDNDDGDYNNVRMVITVTMIEHSNNNSGCYGNNSIISSPPTPMVRLLLLLVVLIYVKILIL